ncbi:MAG TPA: hypothetical protein VLJ80_15025 [Solirubrobacteraceae bacterium]|nr:hypothetical protein [Solirubrobacteraceae bacterium]
MNRFGARHEADRDSGGRPNWRCRRRSIGAALARIAIVACLISTLAPAAGSAAVSSRAGGSERVQKPGGEGSSLEAAAAKAGATGRAVAMSLIGLAFAVAATVLAFRRDFKEAAGVFAVGIVSVLLATPTGISLLRDTVGSLFGGQ